MLFEQARDVYEEGVASVLRVRQLYTYIYI